MIVIVSFAIKYTLEKDNFKVNRTEGMQNIYIKINDTQYIMHALKSNDHITIDVCKHDKISVLFFENSTITYKWITQNLDIFDETSSVELVSEEKIDAASFNPFQAVSDGVSNNHKQFNFKVNALKDSELTFSYVNARDNSQSSFDFKLLLNAN
jgi:hypothetical protein